MLRPLLLIASLLVTVAACAADEGTVRVEANNLQGPRPLAEQTRTAVIRDYLEAWKSLDTAMANNRADLLDQDFVGTAKDKLTDTIQEQRSLGLATRYQNESHDLQIVFYSPEGLSIQLVDNVTCDMQLVDHGTVRTSQQVHARYIVLLTPSEVRWRVRVLQAQPE